MGSNVVVVFLALTFFLVNAPNTNPCDLATVARSRMRCRIGDAGAFSYVFIPRHCGCAAPEPSAVAQLRAINSAEVTYLSSNQRRYGTIPELITQGLLDDRLKDSVSGYVFAVSASSEEYTATAMPASKNIAGYAYYSTADGVIRYATSMRDNCDPCFPPGLSGSPVQ